MSRVLAPETIGDRYKVLARISSGGMGEVYRARDTVLGRTVAVKVLPSDLASNPQFVERFRGEAQAAARLSHPNVVQVYDWGEWDSTYYMVMEFVRGRNLRELLAAHGKLEPQQAREVATQMLSGLQAAHSQGLVHRDIKPENILIGMDGVAKVADFGIARLAEAARTTGGLFGTVAYAAPEQVQNLPADPRTDVYSAGCVIYEMLTGAPPFEGDAASVLHMHLTSSVPLPSESEPDVPSGLDEVVVRATNPDPANRFQSAGEMRSTLDKLVGLKAAAPLSELTMELTSEVPEGHHETVVVAAKKKKRNLWRIVPVILALIALAIAGFFFWPVRVPPVLGMNEKQAVQSLSRSGFDTEIDRKYSDESPGTVVDLHPDPGKLARRGTVVTLVVSRGPELTQLEALTGLTLEDAKKRIELARLVLGTVEERYAKEPAGTVLEQDPPPGRHRAGTPVNLVVSKGPEVVGVPEVVNKSYEEAVTLLSEQGFEVEREDVFNDAPSGTVVEQTPAAGSKADKGTLVHLKVSKGPEPFAMPDVRGLTCSEAKTQLESVGLVVVVRAQGGGSKCSTNKVSAQDPLPGAMIRKGSEATIYVTA